jgi:hypothetical protein
MTEPDDTADLWQTRMRAFARMVRACPLSRGRVQVVGSAALLRAWREEYEAEHGWMLTETILLTSKTELAHWVARVLETDGPYSLLVLLDPIRSRLPWLSRLTDTIHSLEDQGPALPGWMRETVAIPVVPSLDPRPGVFQPEIGKEIFTRYHRRQR